jgi:hypothetical protein
MLAAIAEFGTATQPKSVAAASVEPKKAAERRHVTVLLLPLAALVHLITINMSPVISIII